jgi:hypothetical protein
MRSMRASWGLRLTAPLVTLGLLGTMSVSAFGSSTAVDSSEVTHAKAVAATVFASADPKAAYSALSAADRTAFDMLEQPTALHTATTATKIDAKLLTAQQAVSPAYVGCWAMAADDYASDALGLTLYEYGQTTDVCVGSAGSVYQIDVYNVWNHIDMAGWRFDHSDPATSNVGWEGRGLAKFLFILGSGGWDIQNDNPCLQLRLNADGHSSLVTESCNLS